MLIHVLTVYIAFSSSSYYSNPTFLSSSLLSNPIPILSLYLYCIHHVLMPSPFYILLVKLLFQLRKVTFLFVSVVLSCLVLYLKKKFYRKYVDCNLYCLVVLNSGVFFSATCDWDKCEKKGPCKQTTVTCLN